MSAYFIENAFPSAKLDYSLFDTVEFIAWIASHIHLRMVFDNTRTIS